MSVYWKQSLWLGGVYWIISLILACVDTFEIYFVDFVLSLLLTIFLIPMNFLKPIKWIDNAIKKMPIMSTFLVSVGWVPYVSVIIFLMASLYATFALLVGYMNVDGLILTLITPISILMVVKTACILFSFVIAAFIVFLNKKTVAGCLNEKYKLVDGDACNMPVVEEAYAAHAKKMYKCKKAVAKKNIEIKEEKKNKKEIKKSIKTNKTEEKKVAKSKKKEVKSPKKKTAVKKTKDL